MRVKIASAVASLLFAGAAIAADMPMGHDITVTDAWSRPTPGTSTPGVAYFTITDSGAPDRLVGASSPVAASAPLHQSKTENGVEKMFPVDGIDVAAGAPVKFVPGGYHVMLIGLKQPLKAGDQFPLTLTFAHAGQITTTVTVRPMAPSEPKPMEGMDMHHM